MGSPFTDEEKRFLLAEMIKASRLDVETLGRFIWSNGIEPNWMHMQLPLGRNMTQCMQAAEHMDRQQRVWVKRKKHDDYNEPPSKRMALSGNIEPSILAGAVPSTAPTHVAILPRPASSPAETPSTLAPAPPTSSTTPRKKGRPARADKARFRPILPQQIAPRPIEPGQQTQQDQAPAAPRASIPSGPSGQDSANIPASNNPAATNYSTSYAGPAGRRRSLRSGGSPTDEKAHPRVMAEPTYGHFEGLRPIVPGPVPIEPEPRATSSMSGGPIDELTTLPPLLESDRNLALMGASRVETQAPVANSA